MKILCYNFLSGGDMRKFLSSLLIMLCVLAFGGGAFAKDKIIKFVQVTDVHYRSDDEDAKIYIKEFVKNVNEIKGLSFVVFTGDNIDSSDMQSLKEFLRFTKSIKVPCYFIVGDHDVARNSGISKEKYFDTVRQYDWFNPAWTGNYKFAKKGFLFVAVDGAKEIIPGPNGYYKMNTLNWLSKTLNRNKNKDVIILQHFPLVEPRNVKSHTTYKAEDYLNMLDTYNNVIAIVSGHYHTNKEEMRNGIYHISSPAFINEPHYYKLIEIIRSKDMLPMVFTQLREIDL